MDRATQKHHRDQLIRQWHNLHPIFLRPILKFPLHSFDHKSVERPLFYRILSALNRSTSPIQRHLKNDLYFP